MPAKCTPEEFEKHKRFDRIMWGFIIGFVIGAFVFV